MARAETTNSHQRRGKLTTLRPSSLKKHEAIIDAAIELLPKHGFEKTTMDRIAEAAGVSKQTVYSHFENKQELFAAAVNKMVDQYQLSANHIDMDLPVADFLHEFATHMAEAFISEECIQIHRMLLSHLSEDEDDPLTHAMWQAGPEQVQGVLADYFASKTDSGELAVAEPELAAQQFIYLLKAEANNRAVFCLPNQRALEQLKRYVRLSVELFLAYYATEKK